MSATQTLLQRLRALSGYEHSDFSVGAEAADEIERLQSELAAAPVQPEPVAWEGTEGWEALAWHLCADENGEDACNELVWEGGPIPEPWGDRWMKYEGEAKRMIELVGKYAGADQLRDAIRAAIVRAAGPNWRSLAKEPFPGCKTPDGCRANGCLGWCDEYLPTPTVSTGQKHSSWHPAHTHSGEGERS